MVQDGLDEELIARAVRVLRGGGLVAFPTETVYGLGADATKASAVERLFAVKGRPADNPLIVHVTDLTASRSVVADVTPLAQELAAWWWPGPLTLVLPARADVPEAVTGGLDTVGIRVPAHPVAQQLLRRSGLALAAPSANRSGRPSPTTAQHVSDDFGDRVDLILDGGSCALGVESTVVDARGAVPVILRDGAIPREMLGAVVDPDAADRARSPGVKYRHYAPQCEVRLARAPDIAATAEALLDAGLRVGVVRPTGVETGAASVIAQFTSTEDLAPQLFSALRSADKHGLDILLVAEVDDSFLGRAVMDRLRRAGGQVTVAAPARHGSHAEG